MFKTMEVFNGSIPKVCMSQIMRAVDFSRWSECYVGCSGTFSFERAISRKFPKLPMHGNDVSLMSGLLATMIQGGEVPFRFKGRLEHWEERLAGKEYRDRVGAALLAMFLGRVYNGTSEYAKRHWAYYENRFDEFVALSRSRAASVVAGTRLDTYYAGDFRDHLRKAMDAGHGVVVSAPFIEGWYEAWFRFIHENIDWAPPDYRLWDPDDFPALMDEVKESGVPYVMVYKRPIDGGNMVAYHRLGMKPPFYVYAREGKGSVVDQSSSGRGTPFRFSPTDISKIKPDSVVKVFVCKAGYADYIKGLYLQETIQWTSGPLNFLVYIDDMLAGILTFAKPKHNAGHLKVHEYVYLLSDTSTTRYGRVSKLLAMLATCKDVLREAEHRLLHRPVKAVMTTVRSNQPVSMKYRGIYEVLARKEAGPEERSGSKFIVNYVSEARDATPAEIFAEWHRKHFKDDRDRKVTTSYAKPGTDQHAHS